MKLLLLFFIVFSSGLFYTESPEAASKNILCNNSDTIDFDVNIYDGSDIQPGDTIFLQSGHRQALIIKNLVGSKSQPVLIINSGGACNIGSYDGMYGISVRECRYIRITGSGDPEHNYGIRIHDINLPNSVGLSVEQKTSDIEIDHLEIYNIDFAGIIAKSDPGPDLSTIRDSFVQYNTIIHHNYIHDTQKGEAIYAGNTKYTEGMVININGSDTLVYPHVLEGVKIYDNIIERTGYDGIQVASAVSDCEIYNNRISYDSQAGVYAQMSGIIMGGGSKCDCYNNRIENGLGTGILMFGLGGNRIFNNLIVNAGLTYAPDDEFKRQYGIMMNDLSLIPGRGVAYFNNTIISPRNDGIRIMSSQSQNNLAMNNLIVNPGSYNEYETDNTAFTGNDAFIFLNGVDVDIDTAANFFFTHLEPAGFEAVDPEFYAPIKSSILVDAGVDLSSYSINFDINNNLRPRGFAYDIGAFESTWSNHSLFPDTTVLLDIHPNPVADQLTLTYTLKEGGRVQIQIVNPFSIVVYSEDEGVLNQGTYSKHISLFKFQRGMYIVVVQLNTSMYSKRILVIH